MLNMVDEDNREIGEDEFLEIERKMMADKGAKKILGTLKGECRMALVVAFANLVSANRAKEEEEPNGAVSLVRWLWLSFIMWIKKEIKRMPEKATARDFEDSEPEVSEARRPKQARFRHKTSRQRAPFSIRTKGAPTTKVDGRFHTVPNAVGLKAACQTSIRIQSHPQHDARFDIS